MVLTLVIPAVSSGTGAGTLKSPVAPMGSAHGHTGHVRFLTSIELPEGFDMNFPPTTTDSTGSYRFTRPLQQKAKQIKQLNWIKVSSCIFTCAFPRPLIPPLCFSRQPIPERQHSWREPPKAWLRASQSLCPHPTKNQPPSNFRRRWLWGLQTDQ